MIDAGALGAWLDARGLGPAGEPVELRYLSGGSQNEIYEVRRGAFHATLRIPPLHAPADRDDGIGREYRVLAALDGTDVPHPAAVASCADRSVLGRAFYLMGYVDGWSPMDSGAAEQPGWAEPFASDPALRPGLAYELVDGIARLSRVDWRARGLDGFGRPDGFHERQVDRWTSFLDRVRGREIPGLDEASAWLRANAPLDYVPGIMHGDYQFANVMYAHGAPARLAAIVDWEMATVGDPKLDLAWVVQSWPADVDAIPEPSYVDMRGMPGRAELLERYAHVSGRQVDDIDYYIVLARWKLAIVLERGFQRAGGDPKLAAFGDVVLGLMAGAAELAGTTTYRESPGVKTPAELYDLSGKVALVTGASRGIGRAVAAGFAAAGADVVIASRKLEMCQHVADEIVAATGRRAIALPCHVGRWEECDALVDAVHARFGRCDVLVNNAGMSPPYDRLAYVTEDYYDKVHTVNARGPFRLATLIGSRMADGDGGSIINVSTAGSLRPGTYDVPYAMAKAALNALTLALAGAWAPKVRANVVLPGAFDTDITAAWTPEMKVVAATSNPMGRIGHPDDLVGACVFLASDAAAYVNGAQLLVDGGAFRTL